MKQLKDIIIERLHLNKDTKLLDHDFDIFCKTLQFNNYKDIKSLNNIKELYEFYLNDCNNIIEKNFNGELICTNFELMFMLAAMIVDDEFIPTAIYRIGTKIYKGKNNPYDFSWFEVEDSNENTVLDIMSKLYGNNKEFSETFRVIYNIINIECKNVKKAIDGIFNLYEKI